STPAARNRADAPSRKASRASALEDTSSTLNRVTAVTSAVLTVIAKAHGSSTRRGATSRCLLPPAMYGVCLSHPASDDHRPDARVTSFSRSGWPEWVIPPQRD